MMKNIERIIEDTIAKYREDVFNPQAALDNYLSSRNIRHFNAWIAAVAAAIAILILTPFFIGKYSITEYTAQDTSKALVRPTALRFCFHKALYSLCHAGASGRAELSNWKAGQYSMSFTIQRSPSQSVRAMRL